VRGKDAVEEWLMVEAPDGLVGWIASRFLHVNIDLSTVPVVAVPTSPTPGSADIALPTATQILNPTASATAAPEAPTAGDYLQLARDYRENGDIDQAIAAIDQAIALKPDYIEAYAERADIRMHTSTRTARSHRAAR
jgi:hypothetical protein